MYKQDYKLIVSADINGEIYWQMFRKEEPIYPTGDEKVLMKEMIDSVKHKIDVEEYWQSAREEESKKSEHIPNIVKWAYEKD